MEDYYLSVDKYKCDILLEMSSNKNCNLFFVVVCMVLFFVFLRNVSSEHENTDFSNSEEA